MFPTQSNTTSGRRRYLAGSNLTGKEGLLVLLSATALVNLPGAITDLTPYVLLGGDVQGALVDVQPLCPNDQVRVFAKGAGNAGDILVMATGADLGKVRALPAGAGAYLQYGVADEDFADGQLVAFTPLIKLVTVPSVVAAPAAAAPIAGVFAALPSTAVNPTKADYDALLAQLEILAVSHIALVAKVTAIHTAQVANGQLAIA